MKSAVANAFHTAFADRRHADAGFFASRIAGNKGQVYRCPPTTSLDTLRNQSKKWHPCQISLYAGRKKNPADKFSAGLDTTLPYGYHSLCQIVLV